MRQHCSKPCKAFQGATWQVSDTASAKSIGFMRVCGRLVVKLPQLLPQSVRGTIVEQGQRPFSLVRALELDAPRLEHHICIRKFRHPRYLKLKLNGAGDTVGVRADDQVGTADICPN